jgi:tRNA (guanine37-N1)-methyltransferase
MNFYIITLFPEIIKPYFNDSILKNAIKNNLINVKFYNLRDFALDKHHTVDDTPYGGGSGMLLKVDVLEHAVKSIKEENKVDAKVIYLSPKGIKLNNTIAKKFSYEEKDLILVCGRYEGVDERFIDLCVDYEVSIGDYVLSGGELPALVFVESVSRFIEGVIGSYDSVTSDSFENNTLKYPQYTRPRVFKKLEVPKVLLNGNHEEIKKWRKNQSLNITKKKRKDIL